MSKIIRIGISGKARAGKNTVAEMIVKAAGIAEGRYAITALADPMKQIGELIFPEASKECFYGASELRSNVIAEKYKNADGDPLTYRQFLLDLGKFGRAYNNDIWLNCLVELVKRIPNIAAHMISDIRYINEFNYFKRNGFYMVRVLRDDCASINDSSELEQDGIPNSDFHTVIENNGSMEQLYESVADVVKKF